MNASLRFYFFMNLGMKAGLFQTLFRNCLGLPFGERFFILEYKPPPFSILKSGERMIHYMYDGINLYISNIYILKGKRKICLNSKSMEYITSIPEKISQVHCSYPEKLELKHVKRILISNGKLKTQKKTTFNHILKNAVRNDKKYLSSLIKHYKKIGLLGKN